MNIPLGAYWRLLYRYLRPQWPRVTVLALVLSGSIALSLLNPQFLRRFIDGAVAGERAEGLLATALLFTGAALLHQLLSAYGRYIGEDVSWTATNLLRAELAAHCLRLDMSFHKARTPGEMIERLDGDVNELSAFFARFFIDVVSNLVLMAGVLVLLFREDWRVGLGLTAFAGVALAVMTRLRAVAQPYWAAHRQLTAEFYGYVGERLAGTEDIRSSGATGHVLYRFYEILRRWLPVYRRATMAQYSMWMASLLLFAAGQAVALGLGGYLWVTGVASIGTVYLIFHYTDLLQRPIEQLRTQLQELQRAGASIARVSELFAAQTRIADGPGAPLPDGPLSVECRDVSFAYEDGERVLQDLSFDLPPGTVLGLLGRTGSGKTTLARLLVRLYDPDGGQIRLGGVDIRAPGLRHLRRRIRLVTQDVQLFRASVRDNLTLFDPSIPDQRILMALAEVGLTAWHQSLPQGLDTELGHGAGLSAGEAQLLALARVFLADPGLVILDEASARLDPATEHLLEQAVARLLRGRTAIIIAHRLATVQRADRIMILEDGHILEQGNRAQLSADPASRFSTLLRTGLEEVLA